MFWITILLIPQVVGLLASLGIYKKHHLLSHVVGVLLPPILILTLGILILYGSIPPKSANEDFVCGTGAGITLIMTMSAIAVELFLSTVVQISFHLTHKRNANPAQ
jgi:fumarate reductase subunit D